jgi:hypothetical protein
VRFGRRPDGSPRRIRTTRWRPPLRVVAVLVLAGVLAGVLLADRRESTEDAAAAVAARTRLLPLLDELDVLWSAADPTGPGGALAALRDEGVRPDATAGAGWEAAHAALLVRVVGLDLPGAALGAQRQVVAAVTLSSDAAAVLARAGAVPEASARRELTVEAVRLRIRGEQFAASALAAVEELRTGGRRIAPLPALPGPERP